MPRTLLITFAVLLAAGSLLAESAAWPQYRGPSSDGKSNESIGDVDWRSSGPKVVWKQPTPLGFSSFAVAGGRVFTMIGEDAGDGQITQVCVAMDAGTGERQWSHPMSPSKFGGGDSGAPDNRGGDGPRTTPTVDGDRVYVYDSKMQLACLDAATGDPVWSRDVKKEFSGRNISWENATSPLIDDDRLFIAGGGKGQSLLALDKLSGDVLWSSGDETMTHANPVIATINDRRQIVFFMQSGPVSVDPATGAELWRSNFPFSTSTAASPVVEDNRVYCSAGYGVGAGLFEINPAMTVDLLWRKPNKLMNHWSTPVVHEGHLYGIFEFKKYGRAPLQCVELATGEIKWKERGFGPGNCILVGDKLIVLSDTGEVAIVSAKADKYDELARADVLEGKCWSMPAYANGRIYVRSTQEGACIEL